MLFEGDWTSWEYDWMPRVCHSYLTKACSFQRFCSVVATGQNIAIFVVRSRWKAQVGARVFFLRAQNSTRWWSQTLLEFWGNDPIWRWYFSDGLVQPQTSQDFSEKGGWFLVILIENTHFAYIHDQHLQSKSKTNVRHNYKIKRCWLPSEPTTFIFMFGCKTFIFMVLGSKRTDTIGIIRGAGKTSARLRITTHHLWGHAKVVLKPNGSVLFI